MRFFYADPGLLNNQSHHANSCRSICRELRALDIHVIILGCMAIDPALRDEVGATPFFDGYTYATLSDGDPLCGPLSAFRNWGWVVADNLTRLVSVAADDILYLNSAQPAQFIGLVQWWKALPTADRPRVVMEFGTDPGVDVVHVDDRGQPSYQLRDYRIDARPMLYRFAARHLDASDYRQFTMATFDHTASAVFGSIVGQPVTTLPLPQDSHPPLRNRAGRRPITIAVLGHQRPDKGFHHVPAIARTLLASEKDIRILVHNSVPSDMPEAHAEMRAIAAEDRRVSIDETPASGERWVQLLKESDLILCPYDPVRYVASYSAVATDAVANGIPLIAPYGTSMARLIANYGGCGVTYQGNRVEEMVGAVMYLLAHFDSIANRADRAARRWFSEMGAKNTVRRILEATGRNEPALHMPRPWRRSQ